MKSFFERKKSDIGKTENTYKTFAFGSLLILSVPLWARLIPGNVIHMDIVNVMVLSGIYSCAVIGLNMLIGYAGQISLGHAVFFGIGAYSVAILSTRYSWFPTWLGVIIGAIVSFAISWVVGRPVLKLKGHYLAMATLGLGEIGFIFFREATGITKGTVGITAIPSLSIFGIEFDSNFKLFYVVWPIALLLMLFSMNLIRSRFGRALRALHSSEIAAEVAGVNTSKYKTIVFVMSAVFTAIGGGLFAVFQRYVNPESFHFSVSILFLTMVVVGGLGNVWGAIIGSIIMTFLPSIISALPYWFPFMPKSLTNFGNYTLVLYGLLLIVFMIFMPKGIAYALEVGYSSALRGMKRIRDRISALKYEKRK